MLESVSPRQGQTPSGGRAVQQWLTAFQKRAAFLKSIDRLTGWLTTRLLIPPPAMLAVPLWGRALGELTGQLLTTGGEGEAAVTRTEPGRRISAPRTPSGRLANGRHHPDIGPMGQPVNDRPGRIHSPAVRQNGEPGGRPGFAPPPAPGAGVHGRFARRQRRSLPASKTVDRAFLQRWEPEFRRDTARRAFSPGQRAPGRHPNLTASDSLAFQADLTQRAGRRLLKAATVVPRTTGQQGKNAVRPAGQGSSGSQTAGTDDNRARIDRKQPGTPASNGPGPVAVGKTGPNAAAEALLNQWQRPLSGPTVAVALLQNLVNGTLKQSDDPADQTAWSGSTIATSAHRPRAGHDSIAAAAPPESTARVGPQRNGRHPVNAAASGEFKRATGPAHPTLLPHRSGPDDFSAATWLGTPAIRPAEPHPSGTAPLTPAAVKLPEEPALNDAAPSEDLIQLAENVKRILDEEARRFGIDV